MLSFLCILLGSFQFAFLLLVTGFLLSLAIISRLMEILVTLVHPTSVFLLRQSVKLFVLMTTLSTRMTGCVLSRIIEALRDGSSKATEQFTIATRQPLADYSRLAYAAEDHPYNRPLELPLTFSNVVLSPDIAEIEENTTVPADSPESLQEEAEG